MDESFKQPGPVRASDLLKIEQNEKPEVCEKHGDYISKGYNIGRGMRWMGCPICSADAQREQEEKAKRDAAEREQRYLEAQLSQAGIPYRFRSKDFASYIADTDGKEHARAAAMEFAANFDDHYRKGTVMVFSGMPGTGKSHLAIAIAQSIMPDSTAMYTSAIDAVRMVRNTWRRDSEKSETEVLKTLARVDLLILDEVGVQYGTDAEQVTLFDIIDKRYRDMMPTILLTNQNRKGMRDFLGDRSFDRLREGGIWVTFDWQSERGGSAKIEPEVERDRPVRHAPKKDWI